MSVGRERSWRPERSIPRRREKKLKLFLALGLLLVLTLALVFMLWKPAVSPVRFVLLTPSQVTPSLTEVLPVPGDLAAVANVKRFEALTRACQSTEPGLIRDPAVLDSLQGVPSLALGADERVLIYCPVKARVHAKSDELVLEFGRDEGEKTTWESAKTFLNSFFSGQHFPRPRVLVLLLEMQNQEPGIKHASFGEDSMQLLQKTVEELSLKELFVVTACESGQRSWEYVTRNLRPP